MILPPDENIAVDAVGFVAPAESGFVYEPEPEVPAALSRLSTLIDSDNIAEDLDEDTLKKIGRRCDEGYQVDEKSRESWLKKTEDALVVAQQVADDKTHPWPGAANIKLPLLTEAAIKFQARAYSEIVRDNKIVKGKVIGDDPTGAKKEQSDRVSDYMSWQLIDKEEEWETDTDRLLLLLPIVGHVFRKRYYCTAEKRTKSEIRLPSKVAVNHQASNLRTARRVTDIIDNISNNDVISNQRAGVWLKVELRDKGEGESIEKDSHSDDDYFTFLEQHCWLDLDEDGYEEPYIVTFEKESNKVVRIVARYDENGVQLNDSGEIVCIKPKQTFTDYVFLPGLDGGYYGVGFGQLLSPLNKVANTLVNQLTDAGSLSNLQAGYLSKEIKILGGDQNFKLGEWKRTGATAQQLSTGVFPLPTREPSPALFNLLGLVLDLTRDLASVKDVLSGDAPGNNVPATTVMALIEQGMKTFNAIYKRIYRSLKQEFKQLYALNYDYLDEQEYFNVLDTQKQINREDFAPDSLDVQPVADPSMSTDMQRMARAEALKSAIGLPGVDPKPIIRTWLEAMNVNDALVAEILPEQDPGGVPPQIQKMMQEVEMKQADVANKEQEIGIKSQEVALRAKELDYKALEAVSKAVKNFADAESKEAGTQMAAYTQLADIILKEQQTLGATQQAPAQQSAQPNFPQP